MCDPIWEVTAVVLSWKHITINSYACLWPTQIGKKVVLLNIRCFLIATSRSHGSVRVVRTTSKVNGKCWNLTPKPPMNTLSDRHQIWRAWLRHGYLPPRKNGVNPLRDFFSPYTRNIDPMFATLCFQVKSSQVEGGFTEHQILFTQMLFFVFMLRYVDSTHVYYFFGFYIVNNCKIIQNSQKCKPHRYYSRASVWAYSTG